MSTSYDDAMVKRKQNIKRRVNRKKIFSLVLVTFVAIVSLIFLAVSTLKNTVNQQETDQQHKTLNGTLTDVRILYDDFVVSANADKEAVQLPENRCSTRNSKSLQDTYSCGVRASIVFSQNSEQAYNDLNQKFESSVGRSNFSLVDQTPTRFLQSDNVYSTQYRLQDIKQGQDCYVSSSFLSNQKSIKFSFDCNIITNYQLFELED